MVAFVDCQAQSIGSQGYQAISAPGSTFTLIMAGLLTLFIALFGYRMLLGHVPTVREGVLAMVKIGIVLVLTTSWPAYRTLVYDVALRAPAEISAQIGDAAGLPGTGGGMVNRLDAADQALVALAGAGVGPVNMADRDPPPFPGFDAFAFGGARILYLVGLVSALAVPRLVAGLLLAIAPLFVAFLLFDATRSLFEGWLRGLIGAVLGAFAATMMLGVQLALLEPWLSDLMALRAARRAIPNAPVELFVAMIIFCLLFLAVLWTIARLSVGFRLGSYGQALTQFVGSRREPVHGGSLARPDYSPLAVEGRSRAAAMADAIAAGQRREAGLIGAGMHPAALRSTPQLLSREMHMPVSTPLGQSYRRRTSSRISSSAGRRDRA
ncbi:type IV secretion system protein [Sphingobium lignivorans]|uniref:Type IV secretion system protein VirB6 n=1 Tax=Sphingobium lignivorans TaxID=2735886 RepID=A0ABR6NJ58_9SPHN|nr:type IV secretion system protein [Sphingobium lignivorans]MBB5986647.1 type IV secretion system protein VirB6 [Sphingobium lignivorans]